MDIPNTDRPDGSEKRKHWLLGKPIASDQAETQLLPKRLALPIFASDPLSSVAYAPQEMLMVLLLGGAAMLANSVWVTIAVVLLLATVVASYRQVVRAYPSGGGDYEVTQRNLGAKPAVIVAAALLCDYVMTVAVSVASGVDNIISAFPALSVFRVEMAIGFIVLLVLVNLRGVREASKAFALPTYLFIGSVALMVIVGGTRFLLGQHPEAMSAQYTLDHIQQPTQAALILLILRAFSSGCSALTGVEAISNGVPAFQKPKFRNAQKTLVAMGTIAVVLFVGLTALAILTKVHYVEDPCDLKGLANCSTWNQPSLISQIAGAVFGNGSILFYIIQVTTAIVLLLAANTAFNGFPLLASVLAKDGYMPKSLGNRGDRLVYSNGMIILAALAAGIVTVYQANVTSLIQLYIIGVFVSFTIGQIGMIVHWRRLIRGTATLTEKASSWRGLAINALGATFTALVLIIVSITKFTHGAWIVFVAIPLFFGMMMRIHHYYVQVAQEVKVDGETKFGNPGDHAIVLVSVVNKPILKALDYAIAAHHASLEAIHVATDEPRMLKVRHDWKACKIKIPLRIIQSPYREISGPLIDYIKERRSLYGSEIISVYMPIYVVGHWWEMLLHNRRARQIRQRLLLMHGVEVILVPWQLRSSSRLLTVPPRPTPGQDRSGVPSRQLVRKQKPLGTNTTQTRVIKLPPEAIDAELKKLE